MGRRPEGIDIQLLTDYEDWTLTQGKVLRLSKAELDHMPYSSIQHYLGFQMAASEMQKREAAKNKR